MSEMIERVARALAKRVLLQALESGVVAQHGSPAELALAAMASVDDLWPKFVDEARLAIQAMREPTDAVIDAAWALEDDDRSCPGKVYRTMIDEALK